MPPRSPNTPTEYKLPFPVLKDDKTKVADHFKARVAPEAFVLDHNRVMRYRGRIDNAYSARLKPNRQTTEHDLKAALDALLAGKDVPTPATTAVGCPIVRDKVAKKDGKVTYTRDVLPILQTHCQQCHRPGEVGPFALMTYRQAVNWASDIKEYTHDRKMPPWKPVAGLSFHNERKLSDKELATLATWADNDTPEGNPKDGPPPRTYTDGWQLGKPDLVLTVPEDMTVGPSGKDVFRCFVLPTGLTEDKEVVAVEVRPGNKRIVHHTLNFFDTTGQARELAQKEKDRTKKPGEQDHGPGYSVSMGIGITFTAGVPGKFGGLGGWAPGPVGRAFPAGRLRLSAAEGLRRRPPGALPPQRPGREGPHHDRPVLREGQQGDQAVQGRRHPRPVRLMIPAGEQNYRVQGFRSPRRWRTSCSTPSCRTCTCWARRSR